MQPAVAWCTASRGRKFKHPFQSTMFLTTSDPSSASEVYFSSPTAPKKLTCGPSNNNKNGSRARTSCAAAGDWSAPTNNQIAAELTADPFP